DWQYPAEPYLRGFFSFADANAVNRAFENVAKLIPTAEIPLLEFVESGADVPDIQGREASNIVMSILRRAWESYARDRGLLDYFYSQSPGFHVTDKHLGLGKKIPWGRQGDRRSSMLRNKAKGKIWQFGVTANPSLWPFPQYRLKSRVLFAEAEGERAGKVFDDKQVQHRYRRSVCKGWRNKQWHGRLMAFLELLSGEDPTIRLPVADSVYIKLDAMPCLFTSPVTTVLPDVLDDEDEDDDDDTLGNFALPEEDED
ncbi:MAG: hypothetical protein KGJ55_05375, partial [Gammaproteobacteria bacterium]|nr:hypothetical protein [Gammaproteobacteria bacterium]